MLERAAKLGIEIAEVAVKRAVFIYAVACEFYGIAVNCKDRTLDRHGYCGVGLLNASLHRKMQNAHIGARLILEPFGDSAEYAGQNNSGVSACAEKHSARSNGRSLGQRIRIAVAQHACAGLYCHKHIIPRITVGDREYVKVVYCSLVRREVCRTGHYHVGEG